MHSIPTVKSPQPNFVDTSKFRFKREVKWGPAYVDHGQRHPIYVNDKNPDNLFYDKVSRESPAL